MEIMNESAEMTSAGPGARTSSSLHRGLLVLEVVAQSGAKGASVTEVATRLDFDKSTASRTLSTLRSIGYLHQDAARRYFSTSKLSKLAVRRPGGNDFAALARERLEGLHRQVDEAIHLAIADGGEMLFLDYMQTSKVVRSEESTKPRPVHEVAVGIAVLAALDDEVRIDELLADSERAAGETLSTRERRLIDQEIARARERGWATLNRDDDVSRVAVAIADRDGAPIAAICVYGPSYRLDPIQETIVEATVAAAADLSTALEQ